MSWLLIKTFLSKWLPQIIIAAIVCAVIYSVFAFGERVGSLTAHKEMNAKVLYLAQENYTLQSKILEQNTAIEKLKQQSDDLASQQSAVEKALASETARRKALQQKASAIAASSCLEVVQKLQEAR